jgi:glycosyltransferase involved in cell wall biosynthesis
VIRTGFILSDRTNAWLGGIIYLQNLLAALREHPQPRIEPVLFVPPGMPQATLDRFAGTEIIETPLAEQGARPVRIGAALRLAIGCNPVLERLMRRHGIALLSHYAPLGRSSRVRSITWIPDFQHRHLPQLFAASDIAARDRAFRRLARDADAVILSSEDAARDFRAFAPASEDRGRVLHFVSDMAPADRSTSLPDLERKLEFSGPYFALPNQFWPHKNHRLVVEALALLAGEGHHPLVLCTGNPHNDRDPDYVPGLVRRAEEAGVAANFRLLGMVSHADLSGLVRNAVGVINPSRFEGWSTSVEEGKSLGKTVLLSDIAVHREQAPARGHYFGIDDPAALAQAMRTALAAYSPDQEALHAEQAAAALAQRRITFADRYADIVEEVMAGRAR